MVDTGKKRKKIVLHLVAIVDNMIRNNNFCNHSKQTIKLTHILKVNSEWKLKSISVKSVLCILKIYTTVTIYCHCLRQIS